MIRRFAAVAVAAATGLLAALVIAAPASAGSWQGCVGPTCSAGATSNVKLRGDCGQCNYVPPPPCDWSPVGNEKGGSQFVISYYGGKEPGPDVPRAGSSFQEAKALLKDPHAQQGTWYLARVNSLASPAAQRLCEQIPLFNFVPTGTPIPLVTPTGRILKRYAYNSMQIPAPTLTINPSGKAYVNLASYVWADWPVSFVTYKKTVYYVRAAAGNVWASVTAQPAKMTIQKSGPGTKYDQGCGVFGSQYGVGNPPADAGAGTPPDCGVLWHGPDRNATITATVTWNVTWRDSNGQHGSMSPITVQHQVSLPVNEIQSVNGN
ncbi:MAG TPA: hypothetical protein VE343_05310 [Streptosporangiaceae bacterium]|jgi:hypothetical protein|nr:hypothetical protein [Streptosporangiaceae bacterium]